MKGRSASKIKLTSYDELLGGGEETNDIQQVSLEHRQYSKRYLKTMASGRYG